MRTALKFFFVFAIGIVSNVMAVNPDQKAIDANQIVVKGIFFVPQGCSNPSNEDIRLLNQHLKWSRTRYRAMLNNRDTFEISRKAIEVYHASHSLDYYRGKPENAAPWYLDELFDHFGNNRNTCPYIYVIVVANEKNDFPSGGGRNFNGGLNLGGGLVILSLHALRNSPNFQSTLRHELGHAFGLVHVDVYGYDMERNDSIMSYNKKHHTKFLKDSNAPGVLIPEDIRALAKNTRVFQKLTFDGSNDIPQINKDIVTLGAIKLPKEQ